MKKTSTRTAYGEVLAQLIVERDDIIVLDADLTKSTKTCNAKKVRPEHHFNMGIAEGNMMAVAAGMAASDKVVYASSFAMFAAGRAYEQVRNSICYPNLNVNICATHAGISVGEDGASHQCIEDIALMRVIPNMNVFSPCDEVQTKYVIRSVADIKGPCYIRLGRCDLEGVYDENTSFQFGKGNILNQGENVVIFATGLMVQEALKAVTVLKDKGMNPSVVDIHCIKPIDEDLIVEMAKRHDVILSCEEHNVIGGFGSAIAEVLAKKCPAKMVMMGMQDCFGESGTPSELLSKYELDSEAIVRKIEALWNL